MICVGLLKKIHEKMACIICHDSTSEPLYHNNYCSCKYEKHASCWIDYVHSKSILTCPICRKEISVKQPVPQKRNLPYTTQINLNQEEHGQSLTYHEFQEYLSENIITHNRSHIIQHRQSLIHNQQPQQQESKWKKITKMVLTLSIIVVIVVVITVLI